MNKRFLMNQNWVEAFKLFVSNQAEIMNQPRLAFSQFKTRKRKTSSWITSLQRNSSLKLENREVSPANRPAKHSFLTRSNSILMKIHRNQDRQSAHSSQWFAESPCPFPTWAQSETIQKWWKIREINKYRKTLSEPNSYNYKLLLCWGLAIQHLTENNNNLNRLDLPSKHRNTFLKRF